MIRLLSTFILLTASISYGQLQQIYSTVEVLRIGDSVMRTHYQSSFISRHLRFRPERSFISKRVSEKDRTYYLQVTLLNDTVIDPPFFVSYVYDAFVPEHPDATNSSALTIDFDTTEGLQITPFSIHATLGGIIHLGMPYTVREYHAGYREMIEAGNREVIKAVGDEAFRKSFRLFESNRTGYTRIYPSGGYLVTPDRDSFYIGGEHSLEYHVYAVDCDSAYIRFQFSLIDSPLHIADTHRFQREINALPLYIRQGKPGGIMKREEAYAKAFAQGMPEPKHEPPRSANRIFWYRSRFVWELFSAQTYTHSVDMIGNPCSRWTGERILMDAITGEIIKRHEDGYQEGCMR